MSKYIFLLVLSGFLLVSCKKENTMGTPIQSTIADASITHSGTIVFTDDRNGSGIAKVLLRKDGVYLLALEQMNYKTITAVDVYLSPSLHVTSTSSKLFSTQNFCDNIYFPLPAGLNVESSKYLLIQLSTDAEPAATATLQ